MDESANKEGLESKCSDAEIRKRSIMRILEKPRGFTMGKSTVKGLEGLELNGSDAAGGSISRLVVEGYDTSPRSRREDVEAALRKHFASRGIKLIHASVTLADHGGLILCRYALIYVNRECEAEALKLHGSDMGGRILEIKSYPFDDNRLAHVFAPTKAQDKYIQRTVRITGFDTSLANPDEIKKMLRVFFPRSCFSVLSAFVLVYLRGQDAIDKALKLSGVSVGDFKITVDAVIPRKKVHGGICISLAGMMALAEKVRAKEILGE